MDVVARYLFFVSVCSAQRRSAPTLTSGLCPGLWNNRAGQPGVLKKIQTQRIGSNPETRQEEFHGHGTITALHPTAMGAFAFLLQLGFTSAEDWKRKGHQLTGVAGSSPDLPGCIHISAHLPDPGRAPLHQGGLFQ